MLKRSFIWGLVMVLMGLALPLPFTSHAQDDPTAQRITVAMTQPATLDPLTVSRFDDAQRDLIENLFVGLTRFDARRGEVVPMLAERWEASPDAMTWTFYLRDDIQWMQLVDGEPQALRAVTAHDVVFAVQRACDPRRPNPLNSNLAIIKGCLETQNREDTWLIDQAALDTLIGVRAVDDTTVVFELLFPSAYFLTLTSQPELRPLPTELVPATGNYPLASNLATSGAWVVAEWDGQHMLLQANPTWPLEREGNIAEVDIRFDLSESDIVSRLNSGTLDMARVNHAVAEQLRLAKPELIRDVEGQPLFLVGFSGEYELANNPLVRRALSLALNREQLVAQLVAAEGTAYAEMTRFTPRNALASPSMPPMGFDAVLAQNLLSQAGYPQCAGFPIRLSMAVTAEQYALGLAVVQQWEQNLGCPVGSFEVVTVTRQVLIDNAHATLDASQAQRYPLWLVTWTADYPDANAWIADALHCQFGVLRVGRTCDTNDAVLDQAGVMPTVRDRSSAYSQVENNFFGPNGIFPVIPLVIQTEQWIQQTWVTGVPSYGAFQFDRWTVEAH